MTDAAQSQFTRSVYPFGQIMQSGIGSEAEANEAAPSVRASRINSFFMIESLSVDLGGIAHENKCTTEPAAPMVRNKKRYNPFQPNGL